jgi:sugar lactone lactonase YvrE
MKTKTYLGMLAVVGLLIPLCGTAQISVDNALTNGLFEPHSVVVDPNTIVYVSDSANNRIVRYDPNTGVSSTLAGIPGESGGDDGPPYLAHLNSPQGLLLATVGGAAGVIFADTGNHRIRFVNFTSGYVSTLAGTGGTGNSDAAIGTSATFRFPVGLALDSAGILYVADSKNNAIRQVDLANPNFPVTTLVVSGTTFREPNAVAVGATNQLWVADTRNHAVKLLTRTSATTATLTTVMGSNDQNVPGTADNIFGASARFNNPRGLLWLGSAGLVISDTANHTIRMATNNPVLGATNYAVRTLAGIPGQSGNVNGLAQDAKFSSPHGLVRDTLGNGFLVADTANSVIRRIQTGAVQPPVASPQIGWVDFPPPTERSVLRTDQPFVFNNDVIVAILPEQATETFFTFGPTPPSPVEDTIPSPSRGNGASPPAYRDGLFEFEVAPSIISAAPDVTVKAISTQDGRISSPVVQARFQFKVANPNISGNNAASFTVDDATAGATLWYTFGESNNVPDPTPNGQNCTQLPAIPGTISLNASSDLTFKARAFRNNYKDSDVVTRVFSTSNFIPTRITFGLTNGEPSSRFLARPGQFFYAPVTLQLQPEGDTMYSLQFNAAVTNGLTSPAVQPGAGIDFFSMLMSQTEPDRADHRPPPGNEPYLTIPPFLMGGISNQLGLSLFVNTNNNLLGVGWLFRTGYKYSVVSNSVYQLDFDTTVHDLISYSIAHDTLLDKAGGVVVVGAYSFQVPTNASIGDRYFIQLGSPSGTRDGVGALGSDVYIKPPATSQAVTVGTPSYLVGDAAPFHWLNAGDFGEGMLDNADVMQVFQSAILGIDMPPVNSDLYRAMKSCCGTYIDLGHGYLEFNTLAPAPPLFNGTDATINQIAFGDGPLDVTDLYVTFRRSLDPSLVWFKRFWTNGQFVAVTTPNLAFNSNTPALLMAKSPKGLGSPGEPAVTFTAGDAIVSAGQTMQIPVTAKIFGGYPLRVLGLNVTVRPLDGSPSVTQPVQFTPSAGLGQATIASPKSAANYSAAWLNANINGLSGTATLGTLTVTIPTNAPGSAAYAIHFDHISASPNGLALFPKQALAGLITLSSRTNSCYNDGIPDSWRLRWFGTIYNHLSAASADACGDGIDNWQKYIAGTDPTDPTAYPRLKAKTPISAGAPITMHWPTVSGKQYVIERSSSLFPGNWSTIATNTGTGTDMEFSDTFSGNVLFYRVQIVP